MGVWFLHCSKGRLTILPFGFLLESSLELVFVALSPTGVPNVYVLFLELQSSVIPLRSILVLLCRLTACSFLV